MFNFINNLLGDIMKIFKKLFGWLLIWSTLTLGGGIFFDWSFLMAVLAPLSLALGLVLGVVIGMLITGDL